MPELPEVEFSARRLKTWLLGRSLRDVTASDGTPLRDQSAESFRAHLLGSTCTDIRRVGKQLLIDFSNDTTLLCHLGMTGKWRRVEVDSSPLRWCRVSLTLDDDYRLDYIDPRRFGRLRTLRTEAVSHHPEIMKLGPDALIVAGRPTLFAQKICRGSRAIKTILMDQRVLAGVGNIYAAEALHLSCISPWAKGAELEKSRAESLGSALCVVMNDSLDREDGEEIRYLQEAKSENPFYVYGRAGEPCSRCETPISRAVQQGRSTFWCETCQVET